MKRSWWKGLGLVVHSRWESLTQICLGSVSPYCGMLSSKLNKFNFLFEVNYVNLFCKDQIHGIQLVPPLQNEKNCWKDVKIKLSLWCLPLKGATWLVRTHSRYSPVKGGNSLQGPSKFSYACFGINIIIHTGGNIDLIYFFYRRTTITYKSLCLHDVVAGLLTGLWQEFCCEPTELETCVWQWAAISTDDSQRMEWKTNHFSKTGPHPVVPAWQNGGECEWLCISGYGPTVHGASTFWLGECI